MTTSNLAIVFGPTLFGQHALAANGQGGGAMADASFQNIVRVFSPLFVTGLTDLLF